MISFNKALGLTLESIDVNGNESLSLLKCEGRSAGVDLYGIVDSPSVDSSLKDGFAVISSDISSASEENPVTLKILGSVAAGGICSRVIEKGEALRILSGAKIPLGADAVIAEEFTSVQDGLLLVKNTANQGRNVLPAGSDVRAGEKITGRFSTLDPLTIGLLAAAGYDTIQVVKLPRVAVISTGDEVIAPGAKLEPGKLYASNLVTIASWCARYGFDCDTEVVQDDYRLIERELESCLDEYDVILTSGGAWNGERDLVVKILDDMGWRKIYHRVRMGPGKAVAFGIIKGKAVFCLPGGPPSNHMAFIQIVLPSLLKMAGLQSAGLPERNVRLSEELHGQADWTQFVHGRIDGDGDIPVFTQIKSPSRLQMMSCAHGIVTIPEGIASLAKGGIVRMQSLR